LCTSSNAYKVRALAPNPKVALPIDTKLPYRAPLVRGTASLEIVGGVPPEYLEAARKSPAEHPPMGFTEGQYPRESPGIYGKCLRQPQQDEIAVWKPSEKPHERANRFAGTLARSTQPCCDIDP
jgi:hypothetical protein